MTAIHKGHGKLICVGTGMRMAGQVTPLAQSYIETADVVIGAVPNIFTRQWLKEIAKEYICLLGYYSDCDVEGKDRSDAYPLRVSIGKSGQMTQEMDLLVDQIRTISNQRLMGTKPLAELSRRHIKRVEEALKLLTGE